MKKLILLLCFLFTFALVLNLASGQEGQAMLKIVKGDDGTVKIYDMRGNEIQPSSATAGEPAPVQLPSTQTGHEIIQSSNNSEATKEPVKLKMMVDSLEIPSAHDVIEFEPKKINGNLETWQTNPEKNGHNKSYESRSGFMYLFFQRLVYFT